MTPQQNWEALLAARKAVRKRNTWATRKALSDAHEIVTLDLLRKLGIDCWLIGQALVPEDARKFLKKTDVRLRWWPDILAIRELEDTSVDVWLIDAKAETADRLNYSVEKKAHQAHFAWAMLLHGMLSPGQMLYVWDDFKVSVVTELQLKRTGPYYGKGSGTPFWLVDKRGADGPVYDMRKFFGITAFKETG